MVILEAVHALNDQQIASRNRGCALLESSVLMQATLLSLDSPEIASSANPAQGISASVLQPLLSWFDQTFQQQSRAPEDKSTAADDEFAAPAEGLPGVLEQLQAAVVAKQGAAAGLVCGCVSSARAAGTLRQVCNALLSTAELS